MLSSAALYGCVNVMGCGLKGAPLVIAHMASSRLPSSASISNVSILLAVVREEEEEEEEEVMPGVD